MSRLVYRTSAVILVGIVLNACWKPKYDEVFIGQESRDFYIFKEGSYWIYQDSITNNTDSVILLQPSLGFLKVKGGQIIEIYESTYCHCLSDTSIFLSYHLDPWGCYFPAVFFNAGVHDFEKIHISTYGTSYLHSCNIGENIFNNVKVIWQKDGFSNDFLSDYSIQSYWVKNIGLIRYEIYNPDNEILNTYNLVKYNVKPYKE